jgi:hypothetical protein
VAGALGDTSAGTLPDDYLEDGVIGIVDPPETTQVIYANSNSFSVRGRVWLHSVLEAEYGSQIFFLDNTELRPAPMGNDGTTMPPKWNEPHTTSNATIASFVLCLFVSSFINNITN